LLFATPVFAESVSRSMPASAGAGSELTISLSLDINESSPPTGVIIRERIPAGWEVVSAAPQGYFNRSRGMVKWVLYGSEVRDRVITYTLKVPASARGGYSFSGELVTLSGTVTTGGDVHLTVSTGGGGGSGGGGAGGAALLAGGGGGGRRAMPLVHGINRLTPELLRDVIEYLNLQYKLFYRVSRVLAAPMLVTGDVTGAYPAPESAGALEALSSHPQEMEGDVYAAAASSALRKYTYAETVVIARGDLEVDAIAAVAYARKLGAPILLTEPGRLPEATREALMRLSPSRVVIVGGPVAVSPRVEERLREMVPRVERIWGRDRYETSLKLLLSSGALKGSEVLIIADGRNVSTDTALLASSFDAPILYVSDHLRPEVVEYLRYRKQLDAYTFRLKVVLAGVDEDIARRVGEILGA